MAIDQIRRRTRKRPESDVAGKHAAADPLEPGPAELKAVAEEIRREFPLVLERSGLIIYDVDPHHLQAQWQLSADDLARAQSSFPAGGHKIGLLLRLRRLLPDGTMEEVASLSRKAGTAGLQGQALFEVQEVDAAYQAELGLASEDGGWLLLERSNQLQPARSVRVSVRPRVVGQATAVPVHREPWDQGGDSLAEAVPIEGRITLREMDRESSAEGSVADRESVVEPALAASSAPLEPVFPLPIQVGRLAPIPPSERKGPFAWEDATPGPASEQPWNLQAPQAPAAGGENASWADLPPPLLPSTQPPEGADHVYDPRGALSSRELSGNRATSAALEVHAELRIWGRASPGSTIDLFGVTVRVGADGYFSLRRYLEDPALVSRALERTGPSSEETDTE
jgi:hypothetical protein